MTLYIQEALRTWNAAAQFYRDRGTFETTAGTAIYDLTVKLPQLFAPTLRDHDLIRLVQYHLLEPPTPMAWTGTEQFSLTDVTQAIQRRRDQFLVETGIVLTHYEQVCLPTADGRMALPGSVIDVRRAAWLDAAGKYGHLSRTDERALDAYFPGWSGTPGPPQAYTTIATRNQIQLAPRPAAAGTLDVLAVTTGSALDPSMGILLGIPDDFAWVVKWGALADLLGHDGPARDAARSAYCESRWKEGIQLARLSASIIHADIEGAPAAVCSIADLDSDRPGWMNSSDAPSVVAVAGLNLVALADVPDDAYSLRVDAVVKAPVPTLDSHEVPIGREYADAILAYAQHLAEFKVGGAEFEATMPHYERLMRMAAVHNDRLRAQADQFAILSGTALREPKQRPRRRSDTKLEAIEYAAP